MAITFGSLFAGNANSSLQSGKSWRRDGSRLSNGHEETYWGRTDQSRIRRVDYGVSNRVDRLRGLGNAVVPQVAEFIGRQIVEAIQ